MLAVFDKSVAQSPEGLRAADDSSGAGGPTLAEHFSSTNPGAVTVNLGTTGFLSYSGERQNSLLPRLFAVVDDIFCLFQGHIDNIPHLKQQYGLGKTVNEVIIVIEAFRTLRDRGPYPADQVVRDLHGRFSFVLFDNSSKTAFIAADADASVPFFWGTDSEGHLVLCNDVETIKKGCGKSFAPFPKGCFFTSSKGLQSFEHPMKALKAMPRVDSQGEVCGATYKVDADSKKEGGSIPRVGSEANWSSHY